MDRWKLDGMLTSAAKTLATGETGVSYLPSGVAIHDALCGGHERKVVTVIGARPEIGKTSVSVHTAIAAAKSGARVLVVSTEDPAMRSAQKFLAHEMGAVFRAGDVKAVVNPERFARFEPPAWTENVTYTEQANVYRIAAEIASGHYDLAVVDFAQNLVSSARDRISSGHGDEVMKALKGAAAEGDTAVVLMSQINREGGKREDADGETAPPAREDLKGSGALEEGAKSIVLLHRNKRRPSELWWIWAKSSFAPIESESVKLEYCRGGPYVKLHVDLARSRVNDGVTL